VFPSEQGSAWDYESNGMVGATRAMAALLQGKGLRCELDQWGFDVPHDWPSWRAQIAHHLPRFC
jgi:esterase/lipase superfamily enzyme